MRWGYTARSWHAARAHGICPPFDAEPDGPVRHAHDPEARNRSKRSYGRFRARCGAALVGLADEHLDLDHRRACAKCVAAIRLDRVSPR